MECSLWIHSDCRAPRSTRWRTRAPTARSCCSVAAARPLPPLMPTSPNTCSSSDPTTAACRSPGASTLAARTHSPLPQPLLQPVLMRPMMRLKLKLRCGGQLERMPQRLACVRRNSARAADIWFVIQYCTIVSRVGHDVLYSTCTGTVPYSRCIGDRSSTSPSAQARA